MEGRKKLHRITARVVPDLSLPHPAVVVHGRLVVVGGDCHRLHEEILTAGGTIREGKFSRFGTIKEMEIALSAMTNQEPSESVKERLLTFWPKVSDALKQALELRMGDRINGLKKALSERAAKEALDITTILNELKTAISKQLGDSSYQQLLPMFSTPEQEQFLRNRDALARRIQEIPKEIETETAEITKRFANPEPRLFPVAVTFLVPQKMAR